uniref:Uncharacterized protein n=1 Tax=Candidatus Kentrum sp. LPFa TaxID=2126335 RepID=A0A450W3R0_9GAMM|nr:MAG: hypothetical protein BECKLPF1236B_GA0070989_10235 [Candidatus Kentron sp. LPFa]
MAIIHRDNRYHLSHLNSFDWRYTAKASGKRPERAYKFRVTFSMHCFARKPLPGEQIAKEMWYRGPRERRAFCFERYRLSHRLPTIIRSLGERTCYRTAHGNFLTVELTDEEGERIEYEIYFDVTRASRRGWLNLTVQSAYRRTRDDEVRRLGKRKIRRKIHLDVIAYNRQLNTMIRPKR